MYVPEEVINSVGFIYGNKRGTKMPGGTAFFVTILDRAANFTSRYAVTARHVLDGIKNNCSDRKVYIRLNRMNGGVDYFFTTLNQWLTHPTDPSVDVAVLPVEESLISDFNIGYIPDEFFMNDEAIKLYSIGPGDEVAIVGLYNVRTGQDRNLPIVRIGNIAAMPSEPVTSTFHRGGITAYLIEARSFGGLSGSPVFFSFGHERKVGSYSFQASTTDRQDAAGVFVLLGLIHAHHDEEVAKKINKLLTGEKVDINMGIAIVVPMKQIREVLDQRVLINQRRRDREREKRKHLPTLDSSLIARSVVESAIGEPLTPPQRKLKPKKRAKRRRSRDCHVHDVL
ncbi:MAG: hypothetical protein EWM72_02297 [Nitrospira sp.]|nr:MAG: hypothetical protein EWM72_02297 [Nitrospira sp.]